MSKYVKKYRRIVKELIDESFPKLKNDKIFIFNFLPFAVFIAMVLDVSIFKAIFISRKRIKIYSKEERKAILVHELCHIERHKGKNFFQKTFHIIKYILFRKIRFNEENNTDILVIKKGYGKQILSATLKLRKKYTKNRLKRIDARGYLTPEQIKSYIKKFKR